MKRMYNKWRNFLLKEEKEESEESENILDLGKTLDSGFCQFNPLINQYAQSSPEGLAEMLIFVIATQQQRWYDVVPKFPAMMEFIRDSDGLLDPENAITDQEGKLIYQIPKRFSQLTLGFRKGAIQQVWETRERLFSTMKPLFNRFNQAGANTIEKEEAIFKIYIELLKVKGLGLPKAAFASQLIIGRLGCIDSINLNLYKGLDTTGKLIQYDKKGTPSFKTPGKKQSGEIIELTKGGVKLAEKYVDFLKQIAKLTKSTEARISQQLWDSWVELVALKVNKKGDIKVKMPGGQEFRVPNDYSKNIKGADKNPSAAFRKKYIGKITPQDISRQHDPRTMYEGFDSWNKYVFSLLEESKDDRCTRIAKRKYDVWPSAYASGAVVKCRQGKIWKDLKEEEDEEIVTPEEKKEIKKIIVKLKKASKAHAAQATDLEGIIDEKKKKKKVKQIIQKKKNLGCTAGSLVKVGRENQVGG